jgi:hypothetical protein
MISAQIVRINKMTDNQKDYFKKVKNYIRDLSQEDFKEFYNKHLDFNGTISIETFDKVMTASINYKGLNADSLYYNNNTNISLEEFIDVWNYIDNYAEINKYPKYYLKDSFYIRCIYFIYNDIRYIHEIVVGQGSIESIYVDIHDESKGKLLLDIVVDPKIKFYKTDLNKLTN